MQHREGFLKLVNDAKSRIRETTAEEVQERFAGDRPFYLVDVREESEWEAGHARGAIHLSKGIIERDIERTIPDKDAEIVLYCGGGYRSALSADALQTMGYRNVLSMAGGWRSWKENDYPTES